MYQQSENTFESVMAADISSELCMQGRNDLQMSVETWKVSACISDLKVS